MKFISHTRGTNGVTVQSTSSLDIRDLPGHPFVSLQFCLEETTVVATVNFSIIMVSLLGMDRS